MNQTTTTGPDPEGAAAALVRARCVQEAVRANSGWAARYLCAYGIATLLFVTLTGSFPGRAATSAVIMAWLVFVAVSVAYARRQSVTGRGFDRLQRFCFVTWGLLWAVAAPMFVGAWMSARG